MMRKKPEDRISLPVAINEIERIQQGFHRKDTQPFWNWLTSRFIKENSL